MYDDETQRLEAAGKVNAATANLETAMARRNAAEVALNELLKASQDEKAEYARVRASLIDSGHKPDERLLLVKRANELLASLEKSKLEEQKARSELGTAKSLRDKAEKDLGDAISAMEKLLPEMT